MFRWESAPNEQQRFGWGMRPVVGLVQSFDRESAAAITPASAVKSLRFIVPPGYVFI